jgi:hypothetical protein
MSGAKYLTYPPVADGRDEECVTHYINKKLLLKERWFDGCLLIPTCIL